MSSLTTHTNNYPLFYRDDEAWLVELIQELIGRKFFVTRPSQFQLKHRKANFYPSTGVITIDAQGRHPETGAQAFIDLLEELYPKLPFRKSSPAAPKNAQLPRRSRLIREIGLDDESVGSQPATSDDSGAISEEREGDDGLPW